MSQSPAAVTRARRATRWLVPALAVTGLVASVVAQIASREPAFTLNRQTLADFGIASFDHAHYYRLLPDRDVSVGVWGWPPVLTWLALALARERWRPWVAGLTLALCGLTLGALLWQRGRVADEFSDDFLHGLGAGASTWRELEKSLLVATPAWWLTLAAAGFAVLVALLATCLTLADARRPTAAGTPHHDAA